MLSFTDVLMRCSFIGRVQSPQNLEELFRESGCKISVYYRVWRAPALFNRVRDIMAHTVLLQFPSPLQEGSLDTCRYSGLIPNVFAKLDSRPGVRCFPGFCLSRLSR